MNLKGTLIDDEAAKSLSQKLYPLGDQINDICAELDQAGYGDPARMVRHELEALAATKEDAQRLWLYWSEYAKEGHSYAEFCLAADACAYLARILYRRIDALLC
jgi:hypothetical protein